jgi:hypothetical protein
LSVIRRLVAQRHLAALICAAALLMKVLVPGGYMVSNVAGWPAITLCPQVTSDGASSRHGVSAAMVHAGHHQGQRAEDHADHHGKTGDHGKAELPCVFAALTTATLAAADAVQLAGLIAFVLALGITGAPLPQPAKPPRMRPPLRGPPLHR